MSFGGKGIQHNKPTRPPPTIEFRFGRPVKAQQAPTVTLPLYAEITIPDRPIGRYLSLLEVIPLMGDDTAERKT
ncbi:hypothetical protein N7467_011000 [Penicillium canescens]|nr:hypothetical protein N7467_011000 [Penicillium canescens]